MERKKLIERLKMQMTLQRSWNPGREDEILWKDECGVIISYNQARLFLELLEKEEGKKENFYCGLCGKNTGFDFPTSSPCCGALVSNDPGGAQIDEQPSINLQPLFNYMSEEHGLNLLENELHEIVRLVNN